MKLALLFLALSAALGAGVSESEYQARLIAAAREVHAQCAALQTLPVDRLEAFRAKIEAQEGAAGLFDKARQGKDYAALMGPLISEGENALDSAISDFRAALLDAKPGSPLPAYEAYKALALNRAQKHWENLGTRFEARYGGGEELNWAEVFLDNQFYRFKSEDGPSALEPIFRINPVVYNWNREAVFSMAQVGLNYYFFSGFMKRLNPLGLAVGAGNLEAQRPFLNMFDSQGFRAGAVLHIRRIEIGYFHDPGRGHMITSSLNFQIIKGIF